MNNITIDDYKKALKNNVVSILQSENSKELSQENELFNLYKENAKLFEQQKEKEAQLKKQNFENLRNLYIDTAQENKKLTDMQAISGIQTGHNNLSLIDLYRKATKEREDTLNTYNNERNALVSDYESKKETNERIFNDEVKKKIKKLYSYGDFDDEEELYEYIREIIEVSQS